jgi:hypothetical protein
MLRDPRINQLFSESFELGQCAFFVSAHKAAVACNVRRKNSRQSPIDPISAQWKPLGRKISSDPSNHIGAPLR